MATCTQGHPVAGGSQHCAMCGAPVVDERTAVAGGYAVSLAGPASGPTNGLAIASLVLGILWLGGLGAILAVIFGFLAKRQIAQHRGTQSGEGLATAGIVLGFLGIGGLILWIVFLVALDHAVTSALHAGVPVGAPGPGTVGLGSAPPTGVPPVGYAPERAAQSDLNTALTVAKSAFESNNQSYAGITTSTLSSDEPDLTWTTGATALDSGEFGHISTQPVDVGAAGDGTGMVLATPSADGYCWAVADITVVPGATAFTASAPDLYWGNGSRTGSTTAGTFYGVWVITATHPCDAVTAVGGATGGWRQSSFPLANDTPLYANPRP